MALTKDDIKAIKQTDKSVCFYHKPNSIRHCNVGDGLITLRSEIDKKLGWHTDSQECSYSIDCTSDITDYASLYSQSEIPAEAHAFSHNSIYRFSEGDHIATFIDFLREGDEIRLQWHRDIFSHQQLKDGGLHADDLRVRVTRGKKVYRFLIETSLSQDNSARLIRYKKYF